MINKLKNIVNNFGEKYGYDCRYANIFDLVGDVNDVENSLQPIVTYCMAIIEKADEEIDYILNMILSGDDDVDLNDIVEYKRLKNDIEQFLDSLPTENIEVYGEDCTDIEEEVFSNLFNVIEEYLFPTQKIELVGNNSFQIRFIEKDDFTKIQTFSELINDYIDLIEDLAKDNISEKEYKVASNCLCDLMELRDIKECFEKILEGKRNKEYTKQLDELRNYLDYELVGDNPQIEILANNKTYMLKCDEKTIDAIASIINTQIEDY